MDHEMTHYEPDIGRDTERLERSGMAWPPAAWERPASQWRDDVWPVPGPFEPYGRAPEKDAVQQLREAVEQESAAGFGTVAREILETVILTALIFLGIRLVVQNFRIEGRSMEPTLHSGQYLLVNKMSYRVLGDPSRGDIVVFEAWNQDKDFIKRIVGTPGDEIEIKDGCVHVNGDCLEESYLEQPTTDAVGPIVLGPDEYYVLGDNRGNSSDSRNYGALPRGNIVGKAWLTYWPPDEMGIVTGNSDGYARGAD
ncbi:MAG: signal peptidase I [Anaerolineae bacterium]|jgi:signal peptidase I